MHLLKVVHVVAVVRPSHVLVKVLRLRITVASGVVLGLCVLRNLIQVPKIVLIDLLLVDSLLFAGRLFLRLLLLFIGNA
jgi:hypothetical protein